ncbi:putative fatty-acid--CoA ligase FadD10 [Phlyctochytrium bullatum]|nr:putative fatty-acid--CoA ligase FadD10 [Phlyctochytrium bullatum]
MAVYKSPLKPITIPEVDIHTYVFSQAVRDHKERVYLIDAGTGRSITVAQFAQKVDRFAAGLRKLTGAKKWDVVGIFAPNHFDYGVVMHGVVRAGATLTSANPSYTAPELAHQLRDSGARMLFTVPELLPVSRAACAEVGIPSDRIFLLSSTLPPGSLPELDEEAKNMKTFDDFVSCQDAIPPVQFTPEELSTKPGVVSTHRNMVANIAQTSAVLHWAGDVEPGHVWVGVLPFFHMYGLQMSLHSALFNGVSVVVISKFELEPFLTALSKYKVITAHIVPPIAVALAKHPLVDKFDLSSLKIVFSGAAPLGSDLSREVAQRLKVAVMQGYGMTELSPVATMATTKTNVDGGCGILLPNMEARLVSAVTGKDVGIGKEGELWLRGPNVMKGYHNNISATQSTIDPQGWLKTGDVAVIDKSGNYFIVDRIKELIKYKGFQVAPAELEAHLLTHPAVADAAVIPRPDEAAGELPRAYVVLKPTAKATEAEIQAFIDAKVAPHKRLRGGVAFIDAIPKSPSGKILRRVLRDREAVERSAEGKKPAAKL